MRNCRLTALLTTVTIVALAAPVTAQASATVECHRFQKTGFWDVDIDNGPALPPECGPPLSYNSDRDLSHLPYQIVGILASYIAFTLGIGLAILSIRRKRNKLFVPEPVELKPVPQDYRKFEVSPTSPASSVTSWMRNPLRPKKPAEAGMVTDGAELDGSALTSPGMISVKSFDNSVLNADRMSRQADMDRLYAAVAQSNVATRKSDVRSDAGSVRGVPRHSMASSTMSSRQADRPADRRLASIRASEIQPRQPQSPAAYGLQSPVRAIYPPDYDILTPIDTAPMEARIPSDFWSHQPGRAGLLSPGLPMSPTTPKIELPNDMYPASPLPGERRMRLPNQPQTPAIPHTPITPGPPTAGLHYDAPSDYPASPPLRSNPMAFPTDPIQRPTSANTTGSESRSDSSRSSKGKKILRTMRINTGARDSDLDAEERAPISAVFQGEQAAHQQRLASGEPDTPETPTGDPEDRFDVVPPIPQSRLASPPGRITSPGRARPTGLTLQLPGRKGSTTSLSTVGLPASPASHLVPPSATRVKFAVAENPQSATSTSSKPLPFRVAFAESNPLASAPATKTTFVEAKKKFGPGPRTARTPMTGVPQTPYSAYMPFTPVTPVTPHLMTRKERKDRKKAKGRTVLDQSDMVKEEEEEWE